MRTVCIECGDNAAAQFRRFSETVVKLEQCESCGENVDKYVEFDGVLVSLDVLLHRKPAFRHVLFNRDFNAHWKLGIVFLICTSYTRWSSSRIIYGEDGVSSNLPAAHQLDALLLYAMELKFYLMFLLSALDLFVFILSTSCLSRIFSAHPKVPFPVFARGLVLFSYARLVAVPLLIWGEAESLAISVGLANLLLFTSYVTAVSALSNIDLIRSSAIVGVSTLLQFGLGSALESLILVSVSSIAI